MRGRRSSRSAAVVLAGCVGLAVIAPGMALAAPDPTIETRAECVAAGGTWTPTAATTGTTGTCDVPSSTSPSSSATTPTTTTTTTTAPPAGSTVNGVPGGITGGTATGGTVTGGTSTGASEGTSSADDTPATESAPTYSAATLRQSTDTLQQTVTDQLGAGDLEGVTDLLPLPNLPTLPTPDTNGDYANANEACLAAIGALQFPAGTDAAQLESLSTQLQGFCAQLDPDTLTDLIDQLVDLLEGLIPSLPGHGGGTGHIPSTPPTAVPAYFQPYWYQQYDVNCPELTYEEAQAILAWDPSDPFRLDADDDGIACDRNARQQQVVYVGYPVGGVATGDGSTGGGSDPAVVVLAAGLLSGLGLAGLTLVRRFAREG